MLIMMKNFLVQCFVTGNCKPL